MAEKDGKLLGARIRKYREQADLSQSRLGEKLGVSYQQIQKYERGVSRLSVDTLLRLSKALGLSVSALLPGTADFPEGNGPKTGHVSEPRPDYGPLTKEEKELLKSFRELTEDKVRAAFLATLKAAGPKKH